MRRLKTNTWIPKYEQIKNIIRSEISEGKYTAGSRIPSENELPKLFNVGKNTVLKAVGDLVNDGTLYREQGKGTFVANLHSLRSDSRNIGLYLMSHQKDMTEMEKLTFFTPNYQPDMAFITKYTSNAVLYGITSTLMNRNYYPVFLGREDPPFGLKKLKQAHVTGVILQNADDEKYHPFVEKLKNAGVPYIMVDRYALREDINYVEEYPAHEIYKATKYLLKLGHRRIAGIGFESKRLCYNNHFYGFEKALLEKKTYDPLLVKKLTGNTEKEMLSVINDLFSGKNPPTAIFLFLSPATVNLISALEKHRIKIPEDVSLMAVGHEQYAKNGLKITTIAGSSSIKFGETAANKLVDLVEGEIHPPVNVKLKLKLLEGNSCIRENAKIKAQSAK